MGGHAAIDRWRGQLPAWGIPDEIRERSPEPARGFDPALFRARAERAVAEPADTPSRHRALEALPPAGTVLDVGAGAGAASLPLVPPAARIVAVDPSADLLAELEELAGARGIDVRLVEGSWPEAGQRVEPADVVVCHHVVYNVPDLAPFCRAMSDRARSRVVVEMTRRHPLAWMSDLWERFHRLRRPSGPTSEDAEEALREAGIPVRREDFEVDSLSGDRSRQEAVAFVRRHLCLPAARDQEIAGALGERLRRLAEGRWVLGPAVRELTSLWWDV